MRCTSTLPKLYAVRTYKDTVLGYDLPLAIRTAPGKDISC